MAMDFKESDRLYRQAIELIPTASQTFSKSRIQFPAGATPDFLSHSQGGVTWDVDGNKYVDIVMGLLSVSLGHCYPVVNAAIEAQLKKGISFSLATPLEAELAERVVAMIPSAEMVRFGKNGTDATSAAIRISRAVTGKSGVIALGYHGWQDWYVGATTRARGVPASVRELTKKLPFNSLEAVEAEFARSNDDIAAIILEPMSVEAPKPGYLAKLKQLAEKKGSVLVYDETITGFRFENGSAQAQFGVVPHLTVLGKAMANGMPLSAIAGSKDLMMEFEKIFFSGTFGGEALSLAAALAVMEEYDKNPVTETLRSYGGRLKSEMTASIKSSGLGDLISIGGDDAWPIPVYRSSEVNDSNAIKTFIVAEMFKRGVFFGSGVNVCYSHEKQHLDKVSEAWEETIDLLSKVAKDRKISEVIDCDMIQAVFSVR